MRDRDRYHVSAGRELMDLTDVSSFRAGARDVIRNNGVRETVLMTSQPNMAPPEGVVQNEDALEQNEHDSFIPARHLPHHHKPKKPKRKNSFRKQRESMATLHHTNAPTAIEEWRLIFLAFDKICFVLTTLVLSVGFWLMVTYKGESDTGPRVLAD